MDNAQTLRNAALEGDVVEVKRLLKVLSKEEVNEPDRWRRVRTPFLNACEEGKEDVVHVFLEDASGKVDVCSVDSLGYTGLHLACLKGHGPVAELLLRDGQVDVEAKDRYGDTGLMLASSYSSAAMVSMLLYYGADVDARSKYGSCALHWACVH